MHSSKCSIRIKKSKYWAQWGDHALAQSLSTLWVANLSAEFAQGKQLLQREPDFANDPNYSLMFIYSAVGKYIGSMLSCYALTGDEWFLGSAERVANKLKPAYDTKGLPYNYVNLSKPINLDKMAPFHNYYHYYQHSLIQLGGTQHLEYHYLGDLTKNAEYHQRNDKIRTILRTISKPQGLYLTEIDYEPPHWSDPLITPMKSSLSSNGFYSYLIKSYIQYNFTDRESLEMFNQAIDAIEAAEMIIKSNQSDNAFTFVRDYNVREKSYGEKMSDDACNLGAMFGLSVWAIKKNGAREGSIEENAPRIKKYLDWAQQLTETCHYVANSTLTGMFHGYFSIRENGFVSYDRILNLNFVFLSPHLAESYFVLYRLTKDPKYRQYAWELVQSIAKYAPMPNGTLRQKVFADGNNRANCESKCDYPSDFIGATLKYLYLTFTDDEDALPLDQWVFNVAGQPLPIWSRNPMYPVNIGGWRKSEEIPTKIPRQITEPLDLLKNMTRELWNNQLHASNNSINRKGVKGVNLVQMLSSLWVMGLRTEYEEGKKWIETNNRDNFRDPVDRTFGTAMASTEYLSSLLSCFALTNDTEMLDSAKQVDDRLNVIFNTTKVLPYSYSYSFGLLEDIWYFLAKVGEQHMEFSYLADMTNNLNMKTNIRETRTFLESIQKPAIYKDYINNIQTGELGEYSIERPSNKFHQNLVKSFIQSNVRDDQPIRMYKLGLDFILKNTTVIRKTNKGNLTYEDHGGNMEASGCSLGAMLALGADAMQRQLDQKPKSNTNPNVTIQDQARIEQHWRLAREVTDSCHVIYTKTKTKLAKQNECFYTQSFDDYAIGFKATAAIAESYFVLWRLTNETKYRDYAWELAQAIHKHCRTEEGEYYHLTDVEQEYSRNNYERPKDLSFLSTTLMYLFLTFSDHSVLPLDQWIINRSGQPLPVCGNNSAYPAEKCAHGKTFY